MEASKLLSHGYLWFYIFTTFVIITGDSTMSTGSINETRHAPVIGVLTEVFRNYKKFVDTKQLFIASSYIKWIESSGGQILPVLLGQDDSYYENVFRQTNGLFFPGGDNLLDPKKDTPMMVAAKKLYKLVIDANDNGDFYPIWGTCLGFELLSVLSSNMNVLQKCSAVNIAAKMSFRERGKLFAPLNYCNLDLNEDYSGLILKQLESKKLVYHHHTKCLTDEGLHLAGLESFYRPLAYGEDIHGRKFINIMEAIDYPFYGVQFHPEKPPFEFVADKEQSNLPHSRESIATSRYFGDFFITQASKNRHKVVRDLTFQESLIYAYEPIYLALKGDMYEQRYLFPFSNTQLSQEEFIEHVGDVASEDVTESFEYHKLNSRLIDMSRNYYNTSE